MILKKTAKDGNYNMWSIKIPGKKPILNLRLSKINMHYQVAAALKNRIK